MKYEVVLGPGESRGLIILCFLEDCNSTMINKGLILLFIVELNVQKGKSQLNMCKKCSGTGMKLIVKQKQ